jgi:hypothetical protein
MRSIKFIFLLILLTFLITNSSAQKETVKNDSLRLLIKMLSDENAAVREKSAILMKDFIPPARDAVPYLEKALDDKIPEVRLAAAKALFEMGSKLGLSIRLAMRLGQKVFNLGPEVVEQFQLYKGMGFDPVSTEEAEKIFEKFWNTVNREYAMFTIKPDVDWNKLRETFKPEVAQAKSLQELTTIIAQMLYPLNDQHNRVIFKGNSIKPNDKRSVRNYNKDPGIYKKILGELNQSGSYIYWAKTRDKIGYINISSWKEVDIPEYIDNILEEMRDTRGLILDVRLNSGGMEELARMVAGRFVDQERIYAYHQYRNGPQHNDLTVKIPRIITPDILWRYDRPVVMLTGDICISAGESFVAMMNVCPQVTSMGDATSGASGNPREINLHEDLKVNLSRWIVYLPDGESFENKGIQPDIPFKTTREAFSGERDDLLSLALEYIRKEPLPDTPIAGLSLEEFIEDNTRGKALNPKVVQVEPLNGTKNVSTETEIKIQFDYPMHPTTVSLQWKEGGFAECSQILYDKLTKTFTLSVNLVPDCKHTLVINSERDQNKSINFKSTYGQPSLEYEWSFFTGKGKKPERDKTREKATERLEDIISAVNQYRAGLNSISVTVRTIECLGKKSDSYTKLLSYSSTFKSQEHCFFYADVSDKIGYPFFIVGFGPECGFFHQYDSVPVFTLCSLENIRERKINIAAPFSLKDKEVSSIITEKKLAYHGKNLIKDYVYYKITSDADNGISKTWWIDINSRLVFQVNTIDEIGNKKTNHFKYNCINQPLAESEFFPHFTDRYIMEPEWVKPLPDAFDTRFIEIEDGSSGILSVKWGQSGSKGIAILGL